MEYAEVISSPEKGTATLRRVTPQVLPLPTVRYATAPWGRFILFSTLFHDERRGKDLCTLRRLDPSDCTWKVLYEENLDMPAVGGDTPDTVPVTGIRLTPDLQSEAGVADVWWDLRGGVRRWRTSDEESGIETQPSAATGGLASCPPLEEAGGTPALLSAAGAGLVFVSWQRWNGVLIAMVEDSHGRRRLVSKGGDASSGWDPIPAPGNSDRISGFAIFDETLHATVDDARRGFGLWKLPSGEGPVKAESWQSVLKLGAFRYLLNANVLELVSCEDALYLAVGLRKALPVDKSVGAVARHDFELLRVYPGGGEWDVVIGQPRFTPDGLKAPLSGRGPGFYERASMQVACLLNSVSGLHLGIADSQMAQLWRQNAADEWQEACHGAFMEYQRARLTAAYPTPNGILLITECLDFGGNDKVELWMVPMETT